MNSKLSEQSDELGPYASDLEGIRERARKHFGITPEESARRAALRKAWRTQHPENPSPEGTLDNNPAASAPVIVRQNPSPEGTLDNSPGQNSAQNPSPEGTLGNSPASSVPGHSTAFNSVPKGRLNSTETQTALHKSTKSNQ